MVAKVFKEVAISIFSAEYGQHFICSQFVTKFPTYLSSMGPCIVIIL
jgi:hypothetical protein